MKCLYISTKASFTSLELEFANWDSSVNRLKSHVQNYVCGGGRTDQVVVVERQAARVTPRRQQVLSVRVQTHVDRQSAATMDGLAVVVVVVWR